jgi:phage terminase large subunit
VIFGDFELVDEFPADCKWVIYGLDFGFSYDSTVLIKVGLFDGELFLDELIYNRGLGLTF